MPKTKIFVEGIPLVADQVSGVGHALAYLVAAIAAHPLAKDRYEVVVVAPRKRLHLLDRWPGFENCSRKGIPLKLRIMNRLSRYHLLPKMDLLIGKGIYLFGNFNNWPLTKDSYSLTMVHDVAFAIHPEFIQPANLSMLRKNFPYFMRQTNKIITVSETARQEILEHFEIPAQKIMVVPNSVDKNLFRPYTAEEIAPIKAKYGIDRDYFLFLGSIEPRKNLKRLIQAFAQLPPDKALVLVGGMGWLNEPVMAEIEKARQNGSIIIKPTQYVEDDEAAKLMSGATALVWPSIHEGFGMPPLEALAAQTPAVVADIPVLREVVGQAGIYCDPLSVASIAEALKKAAALSPQAKTALTQKGIQQVAKFSWEKSAEKLLTFLNNREGKQ